MYVEEGKGGDWVGGVALGHELRGGGDKAISNPSSAVSYSPTLKAVERREREERKRMHGLASSGGGGGGGGVSPALL